MRLSLSVPTNIAEDLQSWRFMLDFAEICDRTGVDRIVAPDHIVFGEHLEAYGRPESGGIANAAQPTGSDGNFFEPMTLLAALSAVTDHVRLGTNILLAALRRPIVLAKSAATIDVLSGGRLDLGVGVGWQREEYEAAGLDFGKRGRLLDHTLEVCRAVWLERRANYESPELSFSGIHAMPKPVQTGGVPIWCGGRINKYVARRIARYGAGWITWDVGAEEMEESIDRMREMVSQAGGGDVAQLPVQVGLFLERDRTGEFDLSKTMSVIPALAEAGVTDVVLWRLRVPVDRSETTETLMKIVAAFRSAAGREPITDVLAAKGGTPGAA